MTALLYVETSLEWQIYTPGYLQNGNPRPVTSDVPRTLTYGQRFQFTYSNVSAIDRVVLNRYDQISRALLMHGSCEASLSIRKVMTLNPSIAFVIARVQPLICINSKQ